MESIRDRVAIIGMGCTKFGERWDVDATDLVAEACYEAFDDAGVEPKDIQAGWLGTAASGAGGSLITSTLKRKIPVTRVENACATAADAFSKGT